MLALRRIAQTALLALSAGLIVGAIDGVVSARGLGVSAAQGAWAAAGTVGLVAVALGVLLGVAQWGLVHVAVRLGWKRRWSNLANRDRDGDREQVVAFHSALAATVVATLLVAAAFYVWLGASSRIQIESLRTGLLVGFVGFSVCAAVLLQAILRPLLTRAFGFLDRRLGLPFPAAALRSMVSVCLLPGVLALAAPFLAVWKELGRAHLGFRRCPAGRGGRPARARLRI